jgi:hypothetical protein
VFQVHVLNVSFVFLYVASVASECFKSRSGITHGIHVGTGRGTSGPRGHATRATFGDASPAWPKDADASEQRAPGACPCVHAGKRTVAAGVRPRASVRAVGVPFEKQGSSTVARRDVFGSESRGVPGARGQTVTAGAFVAHQRSLTISTHILPAASLATY